MKKKVVPNLRQEVKVESDVVTSDDIKIYHTGKFQDFTARYTINTLINLFLSTPSPHTHIHTHPFPALLSRSGNFGEKQEFELNEPRFLKFLELLQQIYFLSRRYGLLTHDLPLTSGLTLFPKPYIRSKSH